MRIVNSLRLKKPLLAAPAVFRRSALFIALCLGCFLAAGPGQAAVSGTSVQPGAPAAARENNGELRKVMLQAQKLYDEKKFAQAYDLILPWGEQGDETAAFALALMEARGDVSGKPDYLKARQWWEVAAAKGHAESEYNLGLVYYRGVQDGGEGSDPSRQDYQKAMEWWEKAAGHGHGQAMYSLAGMARTGEGQPKNMAKAVEWYKKAAEQGHPDAQYQLGSIYLNGSGVPKDLEEARKWMQMAAEARHPGAINALRLLNMPKK